MEKLMKIPMNVPIGGIVLSLILLVVSAYIDIPAIMITGIILLHLSGWLMGAKFLFSGIGFFSNVVGGDE